MGGRFLTFAIMDERKKQRKGQPRMAAFLTFAITDERKNNAKCGQGLPAF
jgi:hypothetical protein